MGPKKKMNMVMINDNTNKYICYKCNYSTNIKKDYTRHCDTLKHKKLNVEEENIQMIFQDIYTCSCGKKYSYKSGLYRHKKECNPQPKPSSSNTELVVVEHPVVTNEVILTLVKQNQEFKELICESQKKYEELYKQNMVLTNKFADMAKEGKYVMNQQFNLNVFLNEKCKNALNINEFINSINVSLKDLETTGRVGYVEGISRIILTRLKELDIFKRPIHCCDLKREVLYIKNNDKWEKESESKPLMEQTVRAVALKNIKKIGDWIEENPDSVQSDSRKNNTYHGIVTNSMSGDTQESQDENLNKVIKNIVRGVVIDKTYM
jgi:hypothetical protein